MNNKIFEALLHLAVKCKLEADCCGQHNQPTRKPELVALSRVIGELPRVRRTNQQSESDYHKAKSRSIEYVGRKIQGHTKEAPDDGFQHRNSRATDFVGRGYWLSLSGH